MKQTVLLLSFLLMTGLVFTQVVFSQSSRCEPIYNGGLTCVESGNILIDKKINHPTNQRQFVDQLGSEDPHFAPNQELTFIIDVKNTGKSTLSKISVIDIFPPQFVEYVDGVGVFDRKTKLFTFTIDQLKEGETKRITIKARTAKADQFPGNAIACLINQAQAYTDRTKNNPSQDNVRFCVQRQGQITQPPSNGGPTPTPVRQPDTTKGGLPVQPQPNAKTSPKTGPEALALIALLPSGLIGLLLRKKTPRR